MIALAILAGFLTLGFALVIAHKKMSMEVSRVSEIEAVANLVGGFIRQDRRLLDCEDEEEVSSRLNELIAILNDDYISNSGFAGKPAMPQALEKVCSAIALGKRSTVAVKSSSANWL